MIKPVDAIEDPRRLTIRVVENGYIVEAASRDVRMDLHDHQRWTDRTYVYVLLTDALDAANKYFSAPLE